MNHGLERVPFQGSSPSDNARLIFFHVRGNALQHHSLSDRGKESSPVNIYCSASIQMLAEPSRKLRLMLDNLTTSARFAPAHLKPAPLARLDLTAGLYDLFQTQPLFKTTSTSFFQSDGQLQFNRDRDVSL
jgi:hypothetical protein